MSVNYDKSDPGNQLATGFCTKEELANKLQVSPRTIEVWMKRGLIPYLKTSRRCVRYSLPRVLEALRRFEVKEVS